MSHLNAWIWKYIQKHLFNLHAQGIIEKQFLKTLIALRSFENSSEGMTDCNNSVFRCLKHIL